MKILMLGWELPPHYVGGMGVVCYSLCQSLAFSGADIEFILPFEADYSGIDFMKVNPPRTHTERSKNITYKDLEKVNATVYGKADITTEQAQELNIMPLDEINDVFLDKVKKSAVLGEFDVIHAHDWLTFRGAMLAKGITGLPLIVHLHATEFDRSGSDEHSRGNEMIHEIEYQGMMMADKVIAVSELTKQVIIKRYGIDPSKIEVVHNSIDLDSPYIKAEPDSKNEYVYLDKMQKLGYKVVANVGRQSIQKGLPGFLEAAKLALDKNPKLLFVLVGSGDMHLELVEKAAYLGISANVIFTGFIKGERLRQVFSTADLFVLPSVSEPFGSTPLEAISLGTPVLMSKQSGVSEIIQNALKVDFWDIETMADMIVSVTQNDSLAEVLKENAYNEFMGHSWLKQAELVHGHYRQIAGAAHV